MGEKRGEHLSHVGLLGGGGGVLAPQYLNLQSVRILHPSPFQSRWQAVYVSEEMANSSYFPSRAGMSPSWATLTHPGGKETG